MAPPRKEIDTAALTEPAKNGASCEADRYTALTRRILDVVEREMDAVEDVLKQLGPADKAEAERSARTLASLARTMHEIAALARPEDITPPDDPDDNPVPRDIDALRDELARRIEALVAAEREREGAGSAALPADGIALLDKDFATYAHPHQLPPQRANSGGEWTTWLILGGRGAGKTRAGAE